MKLKLKIPFKNNFLKFINGTMHPKDTAKYINDKCFNTFKELSGSNNSFVQKV